MTVVVGRCIDGSAYEVHRWECIDATASSQLCTLMTVKGSCGHCCDSIEREGQEERLSHRSLSHGASGREVGAGGDAPHEARMLVRKEVTEATRHDLHELMYAATCQPACTQ